VKNSLNLRFFIVMADDMNFEAPAKNRSRLEEVETIQ